MKTKFWWTSRYWKYIVYRKYKCCVFIDFEYTLNVTKVTLTLYNVETNQYTKFQANISKDDREKSAKLNFSKGNNSFKSRWSVTKVELDLYYVVCKFKSISYKTAEKIPVLDKTPVKVGQARWNSHLICIMSWQIHTPNVKSIYQKSAEKKSGKLTDGLTDGLTDWRTVNKLRVPRQAGRGLNSFPNFKILV